MSRISGPDCGELQVITQCRVKATKSILVLPLPNPTLSGFAKGEFAHSCILYRETGGSLVFAGEIVAVEFA